MTEERLTLGVTARELSEELMEDGAQRAAQEMGEEEARIREGVAVLFEDGWTQEELMALSQDEGVRGDIADGRDVVRAACAFVRRQLLAAQQTARRRGVPVTRAGTGEGMMEDSCIDRMSDAQFDAFSRQARAAAMMGRKVRM